MDGSNNTNVFKEGVTTVTSAVKIFNQKTNIHQPVFGSAILFAGKEEIINVR